eukprot:10673853-Alexandrium_andersonii.AAC.1
MVARAADDTHWAAAKGSQLRVNTASGRCMQMYPASNSMKQPEAASRAFLGGCFHSPGPSRKAPPAPWRWRRVSGGVWGWGGSPPGDAREAASGCFKVLQAA